MHAKGSVSKHIANNVDKHFNLLGFTASIGKLAMCCAIFGRTTRNLQVKSSLDFTKANLALEDVESLRFFEDNSEPGELFPGRLSCLFRGKGDSFLLVRERRD